MSSFSEYRKRFLKQDSAVVGTVVYAEHSAAEHYLPHRGKIVRVTKVTVEVEFDAERISNVVYRWGNSSSMYTNKEKFDSTNLLTEVAGDEIIARRALAAKVGTTQNQVAEAVEGLVRDERWITSDKIAKAIEELKALQAQLEALGE